MSSSWGRGATKRDPPGEAQLVDQAVDPAQLGLAVGTAGPADHDQAGVGVGQLGQGADGDVGPLERLDAADEEQQGSARRGRVGAGDGHVDADGGPGRLLVAGGEQAVVDARRHDLDALGDGVVEALQLGRLVVGQGQDGVGAADDVGLGPGPLPVVVGGGPPP